MDIAPIKTRRDHRRTLKEIEGLMAAKRNTPQGDRLDLLVTLVEAWEAKHYPLDLPDAVEAIKHHMEQKGLVPRDLIPFVGSRNRVYEVLSRKRHSGGVADQARAWGGGVIASLSPLGLEDAGTEPRAAAGQGPTSGAARWSSN